MTETRPPQNKFQPRISAPANPFFSRINNPPQKVDENLIEQLFLLGSEGDIIKIKQFVLTNHISLVVKKDNGQNILHVILDNANITDNNKLELVKFAVEYGANVNGFMTGNITPLHLAAKYQLPKICEYLIEKGASVSNVDSQQKTPLFYAISGTSTECLPEPEIKPLIPESKNNIEKKSLTHEIYKEILEEISKNDNIKQHFLAITNTMSAITDNEIRYELLDQIDKTLSEISKISVNGKLDDETKKSQVSDKVKSIKKNVTEILKNKLKTSLTEMDIHPGIVNGWGPEEGEQNKILPYGTIKNMIDDIETDTKQHVDTSLENLNNEFENLKDKNSKLKNIVDEINILAIHLLIFDEVIYENKNVRIPSNELRAIYMIDLDKLYRIDIDKNDVYADALDNYLFDGINEYRNYKIIKIPYFTQKQIKQLNPRVGDNIKEAHLNNKMDFVKQHAPNDPDPAIDRYHDTNRLNDGDDDYIQVYSTNDIYEEAQLPNIFGVSGLYFIVTTYFYMVELKSKIDNISANINNITTHINNSLYKDFYIDDINDIVNNLLSYINGLILIKKELAMCNEKFIILKDKFKQLKELTNFFLLDIVIEDHIDPLLNKFSKGVVDSTINIIYNNIISIFDKLNIIIQNVNKKNADQLIKTYLQIDDSKFDQNFTLAKFKIFDNLYDRPFKMIDNLPNNLDFIINQPNIKKYLIENYAISINKYNFMNFYKKGNDTRRPTIGYLTDFTSINQINPLKIKYGHVEDTPMLKNSKKIFKGGTAGINKNVVIVKRNYDVVTLYQSINDFINVIKYIIIRYIIKEKKKVF